MTNLKTLFAVLIFVPLVLGDPSALMAADGGPLKLRLTQSGSTSASWPLYVAEQKKMFEKNGLHLEVIIIRGTPNVVRAVLSETIPVGRINPDVVVTESVTVVGDTRLVDTRTSEVTTNVTQEQMRYLPQNSRNFLNFAALAPGVRVSDNEFRKEFSAGALPSQNVNVFIDGAEPVVAKRER